MLIDHVLIFSQYKLLLRRIKINFTIVCGSYEWTSYIFVDTQISLILI